MRWRDLADSLPSKHPTSRKRSSKWRRVRDEFISGKSCAVGQGRKKRIAHHIVPFHVNPDFELVSSNLMVLCESKRYGIH